MIKLKSHVSGAWHEGREISATLLNPATEEPLAETSTDGIDFKAALDHARSVGGPALREMTFAERGACLRSIYDVLYAHREELLDLSVSNGGNTRNDAKFDVDGANYTLLAYAAHGKSLGDRKLLVDGESERLTRNPRYAGKHILTPLRGVRGPHQRLQLSRVGSHGKGRGCAARGDAGHHQTGHQHRTAGLSHDAIARGRRRVAPGGVVVHRRLNGRPAASPGTAGRACLHGLEPDRETPAEP